MARPQLAKADTAFQGASVGQPAEPCLGRRACQAHCSRPPVTYAPAESAASAASHSACIFRSRAKVLGAAPVQEPVTESLEPARWKFPSQLSLSFVSAFVPVSRASVFRPCENQKLTRISDAIVTCCPV